MADPQNTDEFYKRLFVENPSWSTTYPNTEEALRAGKILPLLSGVARARSKDSGSRDGVSLRILDLGCGRGWFTFMASVYGEPVGIDPVAPVIESAREKHPTIDYRVGTTSTLLEAGEAGAFDVIVATEVVEHVLVAERTQFVSDLRDLLKPGGSLIVTTDRGELYKQWSKRPGTYAQPEENWLTELQLRRLFEAGGFRVVRRDRIYHDVPDLSLFHRLVAGQRVQRSVDTIRARWLLDGLRHLAAYCQIWMFERP